MKEVARKRKRSVEEVPVMLLISLSTEMAVSPGSEGRNREDLNLRNLLLTCSRRPLAYQNAMGNEEAIR